MDNLDLNIHNYNLTDLLNLFNMPYRFTDFNLKDAKKIVLKTHPDKSGLDKKYFLFFSQAYKYLLKIHQLRQSGTTTSNEYQKDDLWSNEHSILIEGKLKTMNQKEYANWFNSTFEKMRLKDNMEESGYGDWLKSNNDLVTERVKTNAEMNEFIQNKKKDLRAIVVHSEFQDYNNGQQCGHFDLVRDTPENYGSAIFNKLQYEDLKKAHVESVIPVTDEDYHNRKKYMNMDQLNRERTHDIVSNSDIWYSSHQDKLKNLQSNDDDINIQRAYKLMSQDERITSNYNKFWSDLKRIQN